MRHDFHGPWLTLCFELRKFAQAKVNDGHLLDDLCDSINAQNEPIFEDNVSLALPEIKKAIEHIAPVLMLEFLMENAELLDKVSFAKWAQRQNKD